MSDSNQSYEPQDSTLVTLAEEGRTIHPVTRAGKIHHQSSTDTLNLFFLLFDSLAKTDALAKSLAKENPELAAQFPTDPNFPTLGPYGLALQKHSQPFLQMFICRFVDQFSTYLSEVIREVLHSRPEILRSGEQVRVDYVLQFSSVEELTTNLIDRKVADLSYRGFVELEKWFADQLGLSLVDRKDARNDLIEVIETRNAFVHNRGIIGSKYCRNVANSPFSLGQERTVDWDYLVHTFTVLLGCGHALDEVLGAKFSIDGSEI